MLQHLYINNFALIHDAKLDFSKGYTVITGETGSGKSILLNTLQLLLGQRADFKVIGTKGEKAYVEAEFDVSNLNLEPLFQANDIDYFNQTIIRREISKQGRSRAFINDIPVQLNVLKEISEHLVSIHSQYNTLELKEKSFQMAVLDTLAGTNGERLAYSKEFNRLKGILNELEQARNHLSEQLKEQDYNSFQLNELEGLNLANVDYEQMEQQFNVLENAEDLMRVYGAIPNVLSEDEGVISRLTSLKNLMRELSVVDKNLSELEERLNAVIIELKDIDETAIDASDKIVGDPALRFELESKIDGYNKALLKHGFSSQGELMTLEKELAAKVSSTEELTDQIESLQQECAVLEKKCIDDANQLHDNRLRAIPNIQNEINTLLKELKLSDAKLDFVLTKNDSLKTSGNSNIQFLFTANKGIAGVPIENAASGGELSRVMLALQNLIAKRKNLPSIFFDEIDTGVSGDVAQKIGELLKDMGNSTQIFAISHLPQVAAKSMNHFKVIKTSSADETITEIVALSEVEHIEEIARLMSGETINEAALSNAKALIG